jgi:hypothetical protein
MTTTSQDWALGGTLLALVIIIMSAYIVLLWFVMGTH